jgi:hypothetical protein
LARIMYSAEQVPLAKAMIFPAIQASSEKPLIRREMGWTGLKENPQTVPGWRGRLSLARQLVNSSLQDLGIRVLPIPFLPFGHLVGNLR